jgi:hypothetical protein
MGSVSSATQVKRSSKIHSVHNIAITNSRVFYQHRKLTGGHFSWQSYIFD